ncbi:Low-density lipoprotein receptor [Dissostichus eleginoides]|uniref:Low-density lipoprotein receptor n=1 Tax=Dissostichus eleginoides TaxID=100907 RepID=A0AAD9B743_DISEL|nr:Low-density lipoprotein receptor [Dissostichus eleginoides]
MLHSICRSSSFLRQYLKVLAQSDQGPTSLFSTKAKIFTSQAIMSEKKRKSTSAAAAVKEPSAKQQKLDPTKEKGWLQDSLKQQNK